jgi:hypothetical protein
MEQATIPLIKGNIKTDGLNDWRKATEQNCECYTAQRIDPDTENVCKSCEARDIWNRALSLIKRL